MYKLGKYKRKKEWPENCAWPEPDEIGMVWDDDIIPMKRDEETEELLKIKEYFDSLVDEGRLNEDYSLNEEYSIRDCFDRGDGEDQEQDEDNEDAEFYPALGEDYWDEAFDIDAWREDLSSHLNCLKIAPMDPHIDPTVAIRSVISYEFINENLLRQAFTRRAFQIEYGLDGCSEELEFLGDSILNSVVTRAIIEQFTEVYSFNVETPFDSRFNEGELTRIRASFIGKDHLAARAKELGLGKYILYGTGEEETESALEDMMEALIGAVAMDCSWDENVLESVVDKLVALHLEHPDAFLKKVYYELLNAWHQRHFGCIPEYSIYRKYGKKENQGNQGNHTPVGYDCILKFQLPENNKGIWTAHTLEDDGETRSLARERAAERAVSYIQSKGLWLVWENANIVPDKEKAINQLQELFQKKYLDEKAEYDFVDEGNDVWKCDCTCCGVHGFGRGVGKTAAKKKAAYMVLVELLITAGLDMKDKWEDMMIELGNERL